MRYPLQVEENMKEFGRRVSTQWSLIMDKCLVQQNVQFFLHSDGLFRLTTLGSGTLLGAVQLNLISTFHSIEYYCRPACMVMQCHFRCWMRNNREI
jgi:hypothetical protein